MTNASKCLLGLTLALFCNTIYAQQTVTKAAVFTNYPTTITVSENDIAVAFNSKVLHQITINFSNQLIFAGTVISIQNDYDNMQTILVKADNNPYTILQITRNTTTDKLVNYSGMIINNYASDGYNLQNKNGVYTLQKFETQKILEPCSQ